MPESLTSKDDLADAIRYYEEHVAALNGNIVFFNHATVLATLVFLRELQERRGVETPAPRGRIPPENPQLQAHIGAVSDFMQELGPYLGLEDGLVTTGEFIEAAKRIREWCHDHQRPLDFVRALKIAEGVFKQYSKDQPKWWRRMDGTPILNDVAVRMAEAFRDEAQSPVKTGAES
jgi:hypothetical protein